MNIIITIIKSFFKFVIFIFNYYTNFGINNN